MPLVVLLVGEGGCQLSLKRRPSPGKNSVAICGTHDHADGEPTKPAIIASRLDDLGSRPHTPLSHPVFEVVLCGLLGLVLGRDEACRQRHLRALALLEEAAARRHGGRQPASLGPWRLPVRVFTGEYTLIQVVERLHGVLTSFESIDLHCGKCQWSS